MHAINHLRSSVSPNCIPEFIPQREEFIKNMHGVLLMIFFLPDEKLI